MSFFKPLVTFSIKITSPFSILIHNSFVIFLAQTLYTLDKKVSQSAHFKIFDCSSEVHQITPVIYENKSLFFKVLIDLQYNNAQLLCTFLGQTLYTLVKRSSLACNFCGFQLLGQNPANSSCHFSNHKSVPPQILHHSSVL